MDTQPSFPHLINVRDNGTTRTILWSRQPSKADQRTAVTAIRAQHGHGYRIGHSWPGDLDHNAPPATANPTW